MPQQLQSGPQPEAVRSGGDTSGSRVRNSARVRRTAPPAVRSVRPWMLALFRWAIARRRLRRQFRAVRLAFAERLPAPDGSRLIFYLNHPSWWDPLLCMVLAQRFIPGRHFYAPIDAQSLRQYGILRNFGLFPVEIETARGALQFLRAAETILRRGDVLGLTPQGAFTDARVRPVGMKPGLGALLTRLQQAGEPATVVPVALEYTFWNERLPEALVAVGMPVRNHAAEPRTAVEWTRILEHSLTAAQDELASLAVAREEHPFQTLLRGGVGSAGFYGLWQRIMNGQKGNPSSKSGRGWKA